MFCKSKWCLRSVRHERITKGGYGILDLLSDNSAVVLLCRNKPFIATTQYSNMSYNRIDLPSFLAATLEHSPAPHVLLADDLDHVSHLKNTEPLSHLRVQAGEIEEVWEASLRDQTRESRE